VQGIRTDDSETSDIIDVRDVCSAYRPILRTDVIDVASDSSACFTLEKSDESIEMLDIGSLCRPVFSKSAEVVIESNASGNFIVEYQGPNSNGTSSGDDESNSFEVQESALEASESEEITEIEAVNADENEIQESVPQANEIEKCDEIEAVNTDENDGQKSVPQANEIEKCDEIEAVNPDENEGQKSASQASEREMNLDVKEEKAVMIDEQSRDSQSGSLFHATAPPKRTIFRPQCVTALDLQSVIQEEGLQPPDVQTEHAIKLFRKHGHLPNSSPGLEVIRQLQRQRVNSILTGDYDQAKQCDTLAKDISIWQIRKAEEDRRNAHIAALEEQLQTARIEYAALHKTNVDGLAETNQSLKQKAADLESAHREELQIFEARWNSEEVLRRYSKPTPQLLNMKAMEKSMVISRMYDQAKQMRKVVFTIEKVDTTDRQKLMLDSMNEERIHMLDRHDRETREIPTHSVRTQRFV
jgi:hypothetical protein